MTNSATISVATEHIGIDIATGFGPRIVALRPPGGGNLLADLGDSGVDLPDGRRFLFRGGHRLWLAPEVLDLTYEPDNEPVTAATGELSGFATGLSGEIEKTIRISVDRDSATVVVDHTVVNQGDLPRRAALWAITQLRPGGTALLPIDGEATDPGGLQASSRVVGWPYTDWAALDSHPDRQVLYVDGTRETPTKFGAVLVRGWLAYLVDGWLFAKYSPAEESPVDYGATGQVYACADFLELETLGPLVELRPGRPAQHRETWRIWPAPESLDAAIDLVESML